MLHNNIVTYYLKQMISRHKKAPKLLVPGLLCVNMMLAISLHPTVLQHLYGRC